MCAAVLDPPATTDELRFRANELAQEVTDRARAHERGRSHDRLARRQAFFAEIRAAVRNLAASPAWRKHDLTTELLLLVERLRDEIDADADGTDPEWRVREALQRARVVLHAMVRQLEHNELDRPEHAAAFVAPGARRCRSRQVAGAAGHHAADGGQLPQRRGPSAAQEPRAGDAGRAAGQRAARVDDRARRAAVVRRPDDRRSHATRADRRGPGHLPAAADGVGPRRAAWTVQERWRSHAA